MESEIIQCEQCKTLYGIHWIDWNGCPQCGNPTGVPIEDDIEREPWHCACGKVNIMVPTGQITVGYAPPAASTELYTFHSNKECSSNS